MHGTHAAGSPRRNPTKPINIQDSFLFGNLKEDRQVAVALTTGKFFKGIIRRFDRYALVFETEEHDDDILVFKHAIVSIVPINLRSARPVR